MADTNALNALIDALRRLPGVGVKSASRMAFHMLQHDRAGAQVLAQALQQAATQIKHCSPCHTFTENEVCATCLDRGATAASSAWSRPRPTRRRWNARPRSGSFTSC